jgi:hypothetical protein
VEENVCNIFPMQSSFKVMSTSAIDSLFKKLRKFKLDEGGEEGTVTADPSALETVRRMLTLFLVEPLCCPECLTPFGHDGGCMVMNCKGRDGVFCNAVFCLWCLRVPTVVKLLGPNATSKEKDAACHRHVFQCPVAPLSADTPNNSRLFPDRNSEGSEFQAAWHSLKAITKSLAFLRDFVSANTAAAAMAAPDVKKMFADAADNVREYLTKHPENNSFLKLPALSLDAEIHSTINARVQVESSDSSDSSDSDFFIAGLGRHRIRVRPPPARSPSPPQRGARFDDDVQFIMDACNVNRRQATDALYSHGGRPQDAIDFFFRGGL